LILVGRFKARVVVAAFTLPEIKKSSSALPPPVPALADTSLACSRVLPVGAPQRSSAIPLAHSRRCPHHSRPAEGTHDSARMTEIPLMSSLFISTID
jgi:hypothetical protein